MTEPSAASAARLVVHGIARRAAAIAVCAALASWLVFAIEAIDRLVVLRGNLFGPGEAVRLLTLTAASIPLVAVLGAVVGIAWAFMDAVRRFLAARLPSWLGRWKDLAALLVSSAIVAVAVRIALAAVPWLLEYPLRRLLIRVETRLDIWLGPLTDYPKATFALGVSAVVLATMALQWWLFSTRGRRSGLVAALVAVAVTGLVVAGYLADSRVEFTRYEMMIHLPLEVLYGLVALVAALAAVRVLGDPERIALSRRAVVVAAVIVAMGLSSIVYGAIAMDASQNVKALFWARSIVARRAFQVARLATDRDGDGFAATFGGGDTNDSDPMVHPMAPETPGNGVDDNGIGGDLAASDAEPGSLFGAPVPTQPTGGSPSPGARKVLVISIDCLRADHLSTYGYRRSTSPNIDRFAAESLVFENAYAQGTNTGHSFLSMYRSSYADDIFDDRVPTFAALAADAGYENELLNAVRTDVWLNASRWGRYKLMMEDFEALNNEGPRIVDAAVLTDRAIELLRSHDQTRPYLTWIHYFDCHRPRARHPEHDFGRRDKDVFDSNVAYVDRHLGRLFDALREMGRLDDTLVFVIADHGEAFMEHGARDHSNKPYNNNTRVPLIVRAPGVAPARFSEPCALIDVAPTALGFIGLPVPSCYRGIDLIGAARTGGPPRRAIISETPRNLIQSAFYTWALVDWPHKIMWDVRSNTFEVFDVTADPGEQRNLADADPVLAARLRAELGEWLDRESSRTRGAGPGDGELDE